MSGAGVVRFLLRVPQDLYESLQEMAEREHRSINGQIVYILERFMTDAREDGTGEGKAAA